MDFVLEKVRKNQKETLFRLLQFSLYEESEFDGNEIDKKGLYNYKYFENYFTDKDRYAFFIKQPKTKNLLGFVMINSYVQRFSKGKSIAEFLVLPKFRRNKIGKRVAIKCFEKFKGNWEVSPSLNSPHALAFWHNVISGYAKDFIFENNLFSFSN